jgi:hypothetical protein
MGMRLHMARPWSFGPQSIVESFVVGIKTMMQQNLNNCCTFCLI